MKSSPLTDLKPVSNLTWMAPFHLFTITIIWGAAGALNSFGQDEKIDKSPYQTTMPTPLGLPLAMSSHQRPAAPPQRIAPRRSSFTLRDLEAQIPRSKEGNFLIEVPEISYTASDIEVQKVITGQSVETIAQVTGETVNHLDKHRLRLSRKLVQCCAADARSYSVSVDFGGAAPVFKAGTWVKVTGTLTYEKEGNQTIPILKAAGIQETDVPASPMLY